MLDIVDDCGVDWIAGLKWLILNCYEEMLWCSGDECRNLWMVELFR